MCRPPSNGLLRSTVTVLLSGREGTLPATALTYEEGRILSAVSPAR